MISCRVVEIVCEINVWVVNDDDEAILSVLVDGLLKIRVYRLIDFKHLIYLAKFGRSHDVAFIFLFVHFKFCHFRRKKF